MWSNALRAIADYPFTGAGLHTFPAISWANYGYSGISPVWNMTHAHNAYLQVGVDLGVGGLIGFLALVGVLFWRGLRLLRNAAGRFEGWLACGVLAGVAGHLVHSLVDVAARPLGNKPGIIFWLMAGLLLAADRLALPQGEGATTAPAPGGACRRPGAGRWCVERGVRAAGARAAAQPGRPGARPGAAQARVG